MPATKFQTFHATGAGGVVDAAAVADWCGRFDYLCMMCAVVGLVAALHLIWLIEGARKGQELEYHSFESISPAFHSAHRLIF